jgi:hypothetical protein
VRHLKGVLEFSSHLPQFGGRRYRFEPSRMMKQAPLSSVVHGGGKAKAPIEQVQKCFNRALHAASIAAP